MGCGVYNNQVNQIEKALQTLRGAGFSEASAPFKILQGERTRLLGNLGIKLPNVISLLARFVGFSPGVIALFMDIEAGFMAEARRTPSSPPVYKLVDGEVAVKILKHDISPELEEYLMTPDVNIDN